jgi:hypothetical protein
VTSALAHGSTYVKMEANHISRRETALGRWLPVALYAVNVTLWLITGIVAGAWDRLWLALLPLPALGLYLWRTERKLV